MSSLKVHRRVVVVSVLAIVALAPSYLGAQEDELLILRAEITPNEVDVKEGWTALPFPSEDDVPSQEFLNVGGTGLDIVFDVGRSGKMGRRTRNGGLLARDWIHANDQAGPPDGDFLFTIKNLPPGDYRLKSYHNEANQGTESDPCPGGELCIPRVTVNDIEIATDVPQLSTSNDFDDSITLANPVAIEFQTDGEDVVIRYEAPPTRVVYFNGFVLEKGSPRIGFESESSGGLERISPALIAVGLTNPLDGETYTVDYAATGGTATGGGVDYTLEPGTLTFAPGETSQTIAIDIASDGLDEEDETIVVTLESPMGADVSLGMAEHTYTISEGEPLVSFAGGMSSGREDVSPATIPVTLSLASDETILVDYAVTGGTATGGGVDYMLADGTLTFPPLAMTQDIVITIVNDLILEPAETIQLTLSNPASAALGATSEHTYRILDNDAGVQWDGLSWFYNDKPSRIFVNQDGDLEWSPEGGGLFMTRIPDRPLSRAGDVVEISYMWMTDGDNDCPDCFRCPGCFDDDITCIAGTSDIRVGLFQSNGQFPQSDDFDIDFDGYRGYDIRFGPNMLPGPNRWVDCTGEVHKTGNFAKKPVGSSSILRTNDGFFGDYIDGFELRPGEYSLFKVRLERQSSDRVRVSLTLNGRTQSENDTSSSGQPSKIDTFAISMRNSRPYSRLVLRSLTRCGVTREFSSSVVRSPSDEDQIVGVTLRGQNLTIDTDVIETIPDGWSFVDTGGGIVDGTQLTVTIPFGSAVEYAISPPANVECPGTFEVSGTFEGGPDCSLVVDGDSMIQCRPPIEGVIFQVDVGDGPCLGDTDPDWFCMTSCDLFEDVMGSGIDVMIETGDPGACESREDGQVTPTLPDVARDLLFGNDAESPGNPDIILTFANLDAGEQYTLRSYHLRREGDNTNTLTVEVTGAAVVDQPDTIVQRPDIMENPAEIVFIPDPGGTVQIRYATLVREGAYLNGFELGLSGGDGGGSFLRGDCNDDSNVDISDAIETLGVLFIEGGDLACQDACDSNDDGKVDIADPILTLGVLFLGEGAIPLPGTLACGVDPTDDNLSCETFVNCP